MVSIQKQRRKEMIEFIVKIIRFFIQVSELDPDTKVTVEVKYNGILLRYNSVREDIMSKIGVDYFDVGDEKSYARNYSAYFQRSVHGEMPVDEVLTITKEQYQMLYDIISRSKKIEL